MELLSWEFRRLRNDLKFGSGWTRRLGLRALPAAAAFVVGTGGLYVRKRSEPPDAELLGGLQGSSGGRACFTCVASLGRGLPAAAATQRALEEAGARDVAALRRAARRLRGPLERDLVAAERAIAQASKSSDAAAPSQQQLFADLVREWRAAGYEEEPLERPAPNLRRGIDLVTQVDESYGRDLGCEVPLCLLRDEDDDEAGGAGFRSLTAEDWAAAADALEAHGVVRLRGMVPAEQVAALRARLGVQTSALDRRRVDDQGLPPVRLYQTASLEEEDPDLEPVSSCPGRYHYYLRGRKFEEAVRHFQAGAMPLVWEHLVRAAAKGAVAPGSRPYVSEVQLLVSDPCASDQFWHVDNAAGGVTLFVPLTAVPEDMGPTHFLPGTHHLFEQGRGPLSRVGGCAASLLASDGVAVGAMAAGDALIYDARVIHRGSANRRYDRTRMALIFRYDFERPPGVGALGTQCVAWTGGALAGLQRVYAALPAPAAPLA